MSGRTSDANPQVLALRLWDARPEGAFPVAALARSELSFPCRPASGRERGLEFGTRSKVVTV